MFQAAGLELLLPVSHILLSCSLAEQVTRQVFMSIGKLTALTLKAS